MSMLCNRLLPAVVVTGLRFNHSQDERLASGVDFHRLTAGPPTDSRKMLLLR